MLRTLLLASLALVVALGGGALSAWRFAGSSEALSSGPGWHALPDRAALKANPYRRDPAGHRFALDPEPGERLLLAATQSSEGFPLSRDCTYALSGHMPPSRIWTIAALDASLDSPGGDDAGLSSTEAVWQPDGSILVTVGAEAAPGNWLPLGGGAGNFLLVVGLYDRPGAGEAALSSVSLPPVTRLQCRSGTS